MTNDHILHEGIFPPAMRYGLSCDPRDAARALDPQSSADYLLAAQLEELWHPRVTRVMLARLREQNGTWITFDDYPRDFSDYLTWLPDVDRDIAECVPHGYVFSLSAEAMSVKTDRGPFIALSETLRYAMYFMTLAGLPYGDVPDEIRQDAWLIGLRTMLGTEAPDFDIDPRGQIPPSVDGPLEATLRFQMNFVYGHELAHQVLQHGQDEVTKRIVRRTSPDESLNTPRHWDIYTRGQQEEFDADIHAIAAPDIDEDTRSNLAVAAVGCLLNIYTYERVAEQIKPELLLEDSHPPTSSRVWNIVDRFGALTPRLARDTVLSALSTHEKAADRLLEIHNKDREYFTRYGSHYLNLWRGRHLVDRVDY